MKEIWSKFYSCDCGTEGIILSSAYEEKNIPLIDLAFWMEGREGRLYDWKTKLRVCWKILRTGQPFLDMVVLNKETAKKLGKDLLNWGKK